MNRSEIFNKGKIYVSTFFCLAFFVLNAAAQTSSFAQQVRLAAADGMQQNQFGFAVAISGDTAIVGAPHNGGTGASNSNNGAAYIYVRSGTTWTQQQKITASDPMPDDHFGYSVAISGNTVAVGRLNDVLTNRSDGKVYIFTRSGTVWTQTQTLVSDDLAQADQFGSRLAMDGDTLVAGAYVKNSGNNFFQGAAYVFTRQSSGSFIQQQKLLASDGAAVAYFGFAVAISGDTIVVGSPGVYKAYIFVRNGTTWTQQQFVQAGDGGTNGGFGNSVAIDADTMIVGRYTDSVAGNSNAGSAYIFVRSGATWTQQQKITRTIPIANNGFGFSVAVKGNQAFVGVINASVICVFTRAGTTWTQTQELINSPREAGLGQSLAVNGNSLLVGDYIDSNGVNGSAYVYVTNGTTTGNRRAFDFDGDGKADVSVFRPSNGAWYLLNSQTGFMGVQFGQSADKIAPADFDGDGKTDLAVFRSGVWYLQRSSQGFTSIQFGTTDDIPIPADFDGDGKADINVFRPSSGTWYRLNSSNGAFVGVQFGQSGDNPTVGDFDGDGKADIAVFRPTNGTWYRLNGSNNQFAATQFGQSGDLVVPADYDGDSKTDIAVFRPSNGTWYRLNSSNGAFVGIQFGQSGDKPVPADFDGDGKADIAVYRGGAWYISQSSNSGFTAVSFGQTDDLPTPNFAVR